MLNDKRNVKRISAKAIKKVFRIKSKIELFPIFRRMNEPAFLP